jgi:hypothetical protein
MRTCGQLQKRLETAFGHLNALATDQTFTSDICIATYTTVPSRIFDPRGPPKERSVYTIPKTTRRRESTCPNQSQLVCSPAHRPQLKLNVCFLTRRIRTQPENDESDSMLSATARVHSVVRKI